MDESNTFSKKGKHLRRRGCLVAGLVMIGLFVLAGVISALSNIGLPISQTSDRIDPLDQARLVEALNIKIQLGRDIWPEWAGTWNPVIIWNRSYEFLADYSGTPPPGWEKVPGATFDGQPYYRRVAKDPQNFAIPVGNVWAASIATKTETDVFLIEAFRSKFPTPFKQVFPYRLLIQPSETQIGGLLHEDFHVFERNTAPQRLALAEAAHRNGAQYEAASQVFQEELKQEADLLAKGLQAKTDAEAADFVRQFLNAREDRRKATQLAPVLVDYERWLEWEEGMAKYVEVKAYQLASQVPGYLPVSGMVSDPYFYEYKKFRSRWSQELFQLRNPSGSVEIRFYNNGMAESFLLDRLMPDWQGEVMQEGVFLEDLLRQAVEPQG
jgi:hypothetical protein